MHYFNKKQYHKNVPLKYKKYSTYNSKMHFIFKIKKIDIKIFFYKNHKKFTGYMLMRILGNALVRIITLINNTHYFINVKYKGKHSPI